MGFNTISLNFGHSTNLMSKGAGFVGLVRVICRILNILKTVASIEIVLTLNGQYQPAIFNSPSRLAINDFITSYVTSDFATHTGQRSNVMDFT